MATTTKKSANFTKYSVETIYIGEYIDLKKVQENVKLFTYLNREHPLVIKILKDKYAVLTKFGAVSFWNVPARSKLRDEFLKEIKPFVKAKKDSYPYDEESKVWIGGETDKVTFDKITLAHFGVGKIKIISYVLSQSVALERYEDEIENGLKDVGVVVENLKNKGKAMLGERELLKRIGEVLSIKQSAIAHLSLFDKPSDVWDSAELATLYNRIHSEYELRVRFDVLDKKANYLSDISQMLMNFLEEKRNSLLEWIIIILIVIELLVFIPIPWGTIVRYLAGH